MGVCFHVFILDFSPLESSPAMCSIMMSSQSYFSWQWQCPNVEKLIETFHFPSLPIFISSHLSCIYSLLTIKVYNCFHSHRVPTPTHIQVKFYFLKNLSVDMCIIWLYNTCGQKWFCLFLMRSNLSPGLPPPPSLCSCVILQLFSVAAALCPHHSSSSLYLYVQLCCFIFCYQRERSGKSIFFQAGFTRCHQWMEFIGRQGRWLLKKWVNFHWTHTGHVTH